jgi:hypothetical protein
MSTVGLGHTEKKTQLRVVTLLLEKLGYDYLTGWPRPAHSSRG